VRDGWIYGRGVSDDKGNLHALLRAALDLHAAGELSVNVRVLCDGEEELGGTSIVDYLAGVGERLDAAIIFDAHMVARGRPAITTALRGICGFQMWVRFAERELHSGLYGSAAGNAVHALLAMVAPVARELPASLRAGVAPVAQAERDDWASLPAGADVLAEAGARPADDGAAADFYERVWARPSFSVHSVRAGDPGLQKTSIPAEARASVSLRVAPGQDADALAAELERLLRDACPPGAELELTPWATSQPAHVPADHPVMRSAFAAIERATGVRPAAIRSGGSIPIATALIARGTPTILSGFGTVEDNIHSPNERLLVDHYRWALASARELLLALGSIDPA
jgi:acetylornithine deacetylase/succinyl-diaminopimelate desuccinylase-like protein